MNSRIEYFSSASNAYYAKMIVNPSASLLNRGLYPSEGQEFFVITKNHVLVGLVSVAVIIFAFSATLLLDVTRPDPRSHDTATVGNNGDRIDTIMSYFESTADSTNKKGSTTSQKKAAPKIEQPVEEEKPPVTDPALNPLDPNKPNATNGTNSTNGTNTTNNGTNTSTNTTNSTTTNNQNNNSTTNNSNQTNTNTSNNSSSTNTNTNTNTNTSTNTNSNTSTNENNYTPPSSQTNTSSSSTTTSH